MLYYVLKNVNICMLEAKRKKNERIGKEIDI